MFESSPGYLALLHLEAHDSAATVRLVRQCANIDADRSATLSLLSDVNWRPTLVAAVAAAFLPPDTRVTDALWHRFDTGSWVVPQIAAILASIDPDFQLQAQLRLEAHCPLVSSELRAPPMIERYSAAGPADGTTYSAKAANSLQAILSAGLPQPQWLAAVLATPEHQELVASDMDAADIIAVSWGERFAQIQQEIQA